MAALESILGFVPMLAGAAVLTIEIALGAMAIGLSVGLFVALGRLGHSRVLRAFLAGYVEVIRGTPLLIQLVYIYFVLPAVGIAIDPVPAAIVGLGLNYGAYMSEVYRSAILAIDRGQTEAALSLGYTPRQALQHVVIPQALLIAVPPLGNYFIALVKDTSLASVIAVTEILKTANIIASQTFRTVEVFTAAALVYLALSLPLSRLVHYIEGRLRVYV